uniref:Cilia- and flagella-associated protein 251-like n=1 Tax=Diabrotica virgifera virgifera TaxID=50390 RepID=A0A6P7FUS8_DIAVI
MGQKKKNKKGGRESSGGEKENRRGGEKERDENQGEKRWRREVEEKEDPGSRTSANRSKGKEREVEEKEDSGSRTSASTSKGKEREDKREKRAVREELQTKREEERKRIGREKEGEDNRQKDEKNKAKSQRKENAREEGESSSSDSSSDDESEEEEQTPNCNARTKLERLQDSVAALEKLMVEVPNTRVAIKQEVDNLRNRLFDYTEELEESKKKEEVPRKSVCTTSRGVQTNMKPLKVKKMATMGVQVDLENPEAIKRRVDAITEKMAICEYEEITEFLNEDWPEEVFQRTEVKEGDISDIAAHVAVFVTNNDEDKKAMETVKGMFPDLPGVPAEVDEDGGLGTVRVTMSAHVDGTWIDKEKCRWNMD